MVHPGTRLLALLVDLFVAGILFQALDLFLWQDIALFLTWLLVLARDALPIKALEGASPGKRLMGIRVVDESGKPPDLTASFKRNLPLATGWLVYWAVGLTLSLVPIFGPVLARFLGGITALVVLGTETWKVFFEHDGRRLGDLFAGTRVVPGDPESVSFTVEQPIRSERKP